MRKLLNTLYVTNEQAYLALDGENIVCSVGKEVLLRIPFDNIENIVCFSYLGCSPRLMGKCVGKNIPINFLSPNGTFLAKVCGETKGNVFLRINQIDQFRDNGYVLARNTVAAKLSNSRQLVRRTLHDQPQLRDDPDILKVMEQLRLGITHVLAEKEYATILGVEGACAKEYFPIFGKLLTNENPSFDFKFRNKRPPLDPINAMLSFLYTLLTREYAAALEVVGLDSYIGYYHTLRSGRASLACDLVEEARCIVERFVISILNLRVVTEKDFEKQISGAIYLSEEGRKKVISRWQEKKRSDLLHPYLQQKIPLGLLPYVQANLLAKFIRGDIDEYPSYLLR